jgi:hypothetical protein
MPRLLAFLALLALACPPARADTVIHPGGRTSQPASGTITLGGTFQPLFPANPDRSGCIVQNTGTHVLYVFLGPIANATLTNSLQVAIGATFTCANNGGTIVITDAISITTSTTADPFVAFFQN